MGGEHAQFNAALIDSALILSMGSQVDFYGEKGHIDSIQQILRSDQIERVVWHQINVPPRRLRKFLPRFWQESVMFYNVLRRLERCDKLLVASALETSLPALQLLSRLLRFRVDTLVFFHGGLPQFLYSKKRQFVLSVGRPNRMKYVVLGSYIRDAVEIIVPSLRGHLVAVDHPYIFADQSRESIYPRKVLHLGFIGIASRAKGFDSYLKLIELVSRQPGMLKPPKFRLIGRVADDCAEPLERFVSGPFGGQLHLPKSEGRIPLHEYGQEIASLDYIVMPYDAQAYRYVCSGAAMDAIQHARPIIALRSDFFEYFFRVCGDIGYMCNDLEEMSALIEKLSNGVDESRYRNQMACLMAARDKFSPRALAEALIAV